MELSESTASNLSISLTQSELEEELAPEWNASPGGSDILNQHSPQSSLRSHCSENTSPAVILERCSMYYFCQLSEIVLIV